METLIVELSRVGCKQMTVEKRGVQMTKLERACQTDDDIVSSAWKHAAVFEKTVEDLRASTKITDEEGTHLHLFVNMWHTLMQERPELFTNELIKDVRELIYNAVQHEIVWGKYIISEGVLGLTDAIIEGFVKDLANKRLKSMGLDKMYDVVNPIPWFKDASKVNDTDENSFETKVAAYQAGGALEWD